MNEETFQTIKEHIEQFKYTSLKYTDFHEIAQYEILSHNEKLILLYGYNKERKFNEYHWACNSAVDLLEEIDLNNKNTLISFIPDEWVEDFKQIGFVIYAIFHDYFNPDISNIEIKDKPELLQDSECEEASLVTLSCYEQSRGFHGETANWVKCWINNEEPAAIEAGARNCAVIVHREKSVIAGVVCTAIYGHESQKGPVAWIREIAVRPDYQNQGIARKLILQAINYGKLHGATRAFLMADECNEHAIHLYEKTGFIANKDDSQIDMLLL